MKRGISIVLILLMLAAMFHITVAIHFCGGEVAASLISLSGKLASCGMEGQGRELPLSGTYFTKHCCEDVVTSYGTDRNYTPSFSFISDSCQHNFQFFSIPTGYPAYTPAVLKSQYTDPSPPGALMSNNVDLAGICIFRI
jgi:hypothetical protein